MGHAPPAIGKCDGRLDVYLNLVFDDFHGIFYGSSDEVSNEAGNNVALGKIPENEGKGVLDDEVVRVDEGHQVLGILVALKEREAVWKRVKELRLDLKRMCEVSLG